ncbi:MAG: hypothetical protein GWN79_25580 [Actinobacteria bacterium]|nr:hypothetical protein [Actinomycetota bacterium]NIT98588.1 hypothetical protein [Actinomycetota bacterium]NIU22217.1 hypothetical protein [Actinomycetota bacterium]NIV58771.1 hypothetical protein [Actinomycetota bacterium]NIX53564.1 hypothetical protein [Actinomycetota bacterium]
MIDNDLLGAVNRTVRGIDVTEASLGAKVIEDVVSGAGHFLGHEQTLDLMQREYLYPDVGDRLSPDDWVDAGATSVAGRAHERVKRTLATHFPGHLSPAVDAEIRRRFPILLDPAALTGDDRRW